MSSLIFTFIFLLSYIVVVIAIAYSLLLATSKFTTLNEFKVFIIFTVAIILTGILLTMQIKTKYYTIVDLKNKKVTVKTTNEFFFCKKTKEKIYSINEIKQ